MYHAAVRMTLNAGVPAERRTTPELGVLPGRPPAAGCADLEVGVPWPGRHSPRWRGAERRTTPELGVLPGRPPAAGCADLEVGVPWPASLCTVAEVVPLPGRRLCTVAWGREANHPRTRGPSLPPACGGLCRPGGRRSLAWASLCTVAWGREANHPRTRGPSLPPACGGLCRPGGRRSLAWASLSTVAWGREANHPRTRGPSLPPACGGLCRPGGRRSLACTSLSTVAWGREANHPQNTRNEPERYPPRPHDTDDHGQSSGRSQSPAFTGLFRI